MPGPMSRVVSPLHLIANLRSVPSGNYHVELWIEPLQPGGEPRLLYREVQRIISNPVNWVYLDQEIQFELNRVSEFGQLRLSIFDTVRSPSVDQLGRPAPALDGVEHHHPRQLEDRAHRDPRAHPQPAHPGRQGDRQRDGQAQRRLHAGGAGRRRWCQWSATARCIVTPSADGSYVPYAVEVPYTVEVATWVRLRISESSTRIPGMEHLTSVQVLLSP